MRSYTDAYNQARVTGTKPLIHAYIKTDVAWRCFGKELPKEAHLLTATYDIYEWQARVLTFGDWRIALSSESDQAYLSLSQQEMPSYAITLDNADRYFTELLADETLLNGQIILTQGFDAPGFLAADFITLYVGVIEDFELTTTTLLIKSTQAVQAATPEDPAVDSTTIYSLSNTGTGETAAAESYTYAELQALFYTEECWKTIITVEIDEITGYKQSLVTIENDTYANTRLEIGIDETGHPYVQWDAAAPSAASTNYQEFVSSIIAPTGTPQQITVICDPVTNEVQIICGNGIDQFAIPSDTGILISDTGNDRIVKRDSDLVYIAKVGSEGSGDDQFSAPAGITTDDTYLYIADKSNHRIVKRLTSDLSFVAKIGSAGAGDDQFQSPTGITTDSTYLYIADHGNDRFVKRRCDDLSFVAKCDWDHDDPTYNFENPYAITTDGTYLYSTERDVIGASTYNITKRQCSDFAYINRFAGDIPPFNGPYGITYYDGMLYLCDSNNHRIVVLLPSLSILTTFGSYGSGNDQFDLPNDISADATYLYIADYGNDRIVKRRKDTFAYVSKIGESGSGDDQFSSPSGIIAYDNGVLGHLMNQDDDGNDTVSIGKNMKGDIVSVQHFTSPAGVEDLAEQSRLINTDSDAETDFPDEFTGTTGFADEPDVEDGTWEEFGEIDKATAEATLQESMTVESQLIIPTTSSAPGSYDAYPNAGSNQQNVMLPLPYGDMRENSDAGAWSCPCIDTLNFVYCVSGWPILSVANGNAVSVYVDGILQSSGYTFDESNDYLSKGAIATLIFSADPGGDVTIKCKGKTSSGTLLTNPIDIIEDLMDYAATRAGSTEWAKDELSFAMAREETLARGYTCAGVIASNQSLGYWIKSILASFLGTFYFDAQGRMTIRLMPAENATDIHETIEEYEAITVKASQNLKNLCTRVICNYALSLAKVDRRYKTGGEASYFRTADTSNADSVRKYGETIWKLDLNWTRNTTTINNLIALLLQRFSMPFWTIAYQGQDCKFLPLDLFDRLQGTFNFFPNQTALCELKEKTINLDDWTSTLIMQVNTLADTEIAPTTLYYALQTTSATRGADDTLAFATLSPIFFGSATWTTTIQFRLDSIDEAHYFLAFRNDTYGLRLYLEINEDNHPQVRLAADLTAELDPIIIAGENITLTSSDIGKHLTMTIAWDDTSKTCTFGVTGYSDDVVDISSSAPNGFDRTSQGSGFDELYIGEGVIGSIYSIQWGATWLVRNDSGTADPTDFVDVVGDLDIPLDEGVWVLW